MTLFLVLVMVQYFGERKMFLVIILEKYFYMIFVLQGSLGRFDVYLNMAMHSDDQKAAWLWMLIVFRLRM